MQRKILVIEDEAPFQELIEQALAPAGFAIEIASNGMTGCEIGLRGEFDAVILDVKLPDMDGFAVCAKLRATLPALPILMLTSQSEISDKLEGLAAGADDYVTKPFDARELVARVEALLRRTALLKSPAIQTLSFGPLVINLLARKVRLDEMLVDLTLKEYDLLVFFALKPGVVFSRKELMKEIWGITAADFEPTVTVHLSRLRAKIEAPNIPVFIQTVHGQGYRFMPPEDAGE